MNLDKFTLKSKQLNNFNELIPSVGSKNFDGVAFLDELKIGFNENVVVEPHEVFKDNKIEDKRVDLNEILQNNAVQNINMSVAQSAKTKNGEIVTTDFNDEIQNNIVKNINTEFKETVVNKETIYSKDGVNVISGTNVTQKVLNDSDFVSHTNDAKHVETNSAVNSSNSASQNLNVNFAKIVNSNNAENINIDLKEILTTNNVENVNINLNEVLRPEKNIIINDDLNQTVKAMVDAKSHPAVDQAHTPVAQPQSVVDQTQSTVSQPQPVVDQAQSTVAYPQPVIDQTQSTVSHPQPVVDQAHSPVSHPQPVVDYAPSQNTKTKDSIETAQAVVVENQNLNKILDEVKINNKNNTVQKFVKNEFEPVFVDETSANNSAKLEPEVNKAVKADVSFDNSQIDSDSDLQINNTFHSQTVMEELSKVVEETIKHVKNDSLSTPATKTISNIEIPTFILESPNVDKIQKSLNSSYNENVKVSLDTSEFTFDVDNVNFADKTSNVTLDNSVAKNEMPVFKAEFAQSKQSEEKITGFAAQIETPIDEFVQFAADKNPVPQMNTAHVADQIVTQFKTQEMSVLKPSQINQNIGSEQKLDKKLKQNNLDDVVSQLSDELDVEMADDASPELRKTVVEIKPVMTPIKLNVEKSIDADVYEKLSYMDKALKSTEPVKTKKITKAEQKARVKEIEKTSSEAKSIQMTSSDAQFFINVAQSVQAGEKANINLANLADASEAQSYKNIQVSTNLLAALNEAVKNNQPFRIDFDKDVSVIIKVSKDGKISADFIPGDKAVENYLRNNMPLLKQRFDEEDLSYSNLSYRQSKQDENPNKRNKEKKDE